jgi:Uma2 family endonuclease
MTLVDWGELPEDEPGEWIDGRLEGEEVPDFVHELVVGWFIGALREWIVSRGGVVAGSEAKFAVSSRRGRKPDASLYLPGTQFPPRRGVIRVPPYVAVEVVSPRPRDGRRDRVEKIREYAGFGVRYYWIVDPAIRVIEILELGKDGRYVLTLSASEGVVRKVPGCNGLKLNLDSLWREVDRLPED